MNSIETKKKLRSDIRGLRAAYDKVIKESKGRRQSEISDAELIALAEVSGALDWMENPAENIYTRKDGKPASWPTKRTKGAA